MLLKRRKDTRNFGISFDHLIRTFLRVSTHFKKVPCLAPCLKLLYNSITYLIKITFFSKAYTPFACLDLIVCSSSLRLRVKYVEPYGITGLTNLLTMGWFFTISTISILFNSFTAFEIHSVIT